MSDPKLNELSFEAHESLCRRCGMSCHFAVPVNGLPVVVDDLHCKYLGKDDQGLFGCTIYDERLLRAPWCATVEESLEDGLLAQDCLYTKFAPGYKGKTRLHRRLMEKALPHIRAHILAEGVPYGVSEEGLRAFLERTGGGDFRFQQSADGVRIHIVATEETPESS